MTIEETKIIALLHVASQRLMRAGVATEEMRKAYIGRDRQGVEAADVDLAEHIDVATASLEEVFRISTGYKSARLAVAQIAARQQGGLIH